MESSISLETAICKVVDPDVCDIGGPYLDEAKRELVDVSLAWSPYRSRSRKSSRWLITLPMVIAKPMGISMKLL